MALLLSAVLSCLPMRASYLPSPPIFIVHCDTIMNTSLGRILIMHTRDLRLSPKHTTVVFPFSTSHRCLLSVNQFVDLLAADISRPAPPHAPHSNVSSIFDSTSPTVYIPYVALISCATMTYYRMGANTHTHTISSLPLDRIVQNVHEYWRFIIDVSCPSNRIPVCVCECMKTCICPVYLYNWPVCTRARPSLPAAAAAARQRTHASVCVHRAVVTRGIIVRRVNRTCTAH
jgi:hypothetical protein